MRSPKLQTCDSPTGHSFQYGILLFPTFLSLFQAWTHQVSLSENNGQIESFLLWNGTTEHQGLTAGTAEVHGLNQPWYTSPVSQSQPSIGWWHFTVGGHSAFISFLLKSYPAFPVTTDGLQHSYLPAKVACNSKIRSHNTFPQTFFTARSNFKPWYYCSGLTIWNAIW